MSLKKYENIGSSPIRLSKSLTLQPGEQTEEFVALDPGTEKFLMDIGGLKALDEKKKSELPENVAPTAGQALTESDVKQIEKDNKKKK